ncbi:hypothetical protein EXU57_07315 [Segetibacter sp. 3557_3]|uniref:hypothetical protein n=1 Tax=Segetibacter sp. 3557_3 TaxID=2547429 RepID=UPI001058DE97|nr:hypothetical protein [Segetibacter sp. 3557_3]TDH27387.1 hypothetical protein EXU57_07315 [Segetibacter sp. 3557_3]
MKKIIIGSVALFFAAVTDANAGTFSTTEKFVVQDTTRKSQDSSQKAPVKAEDLPKAVKDILAGDEFKEWTVSSASWIKGNREYYEIALAKGTEARVVKLDKEGKKVE